MAWEDRDYYRGGGSPGDYLGQPQRLMELSAPLGTWFGVRVRASIWLIAYFCFDVATVLHHVAFLDICVTLVTVLALLIIHEIGHRCFAQLVGGTLNDFVLWPFGGMVDPECPPTPLSKVMAHGGGIIANICTATVAGVWLRVIHYPLRLNWWVINPLFAFFSHHPFTSDVLHDPATILIVALVTSLQLIMANLLPYYWFDGGHMLDGAIQSKLGQYRATSYTCIAGMVVALPLILMGWYSESLLAVIIVLLLFADSFNRYRELRGGGGEAASPYAASAFDTSDIAPRRRKQSRWAGKSAVKQAAKRAAAERRDQAKIDQILEKVHTKGMQSLTWFEKRALRKATERQRNR